MNPLEQLRRELNNCCERHTASLLVDIAQTGSIHSRSAYLHAETLYALMYKRPSIVVSCELIKCMAMLCYSVSVLHRAKELGIDVDKLLQNPSKEIKKCSKEKKFNPGDN